LDFRLSNWTLAILAESSSWSSRCLVVHLSFKSVSVVIFDSYFLHYIYIILKYQGLHPALKWCKATTSEQGVGRHGLTPPPKKYYSPNIMKPISPFGLGVKNFAKYFSLFRIMLFDSHIADWISILYLTSGFLCLEKLWLKLHSRN